MPSAVTDEARFQLLHQRIDAAVDGDVAANWIAQIRLEHLKQQLQTLSR